jgi:hypothetical protein
MIEDQRKAINMKMFWTIELILLFNFYILK